MSKLMKILICYAICYAASALVILLLLSTYIDIGSQYTRKICVDKSDKIEQALSNAVEDVVSKKFIVTRICIKRGLVDRNFKIEVGGVSGDYLVLLED